jgi:DHA3 family macrolide efflux protein-like MFS transporter
MNEVQPVGRLVRWKPRFFTIWTGQALSLIGSALTQFVLIWWITETTGSANALALAGIAALLPTAIFGPLGGALADRWSRRMVMIVADSITALSMVILVVLFATNSIQLWQVYTLMFVRATMQAFQGPAALASTPNLAPPEWLTRIAGMNQSLQGVMTIAAAPLGALALAFLPLQGALMIDVVTAVLGIVPLLFYRIPQPPPSSAATGNSVLADIREGARYIAHRRGLWMLYLVVGLVVLTVMPTFALTPLLVTQHFKGGVNQVALMEGFAGIGIIVGGLFITMRTWSSQRIRVVMISFAISCGTVALTALAPANWLWLAVFWWTVSGFTFSTGNAPMMAILQTIIPNELQGRAFSLLNVVFGLAGPLGLVIAGPLAEALGVRTLFILGGTLSALICVGAYLFSKSLRTIETPVRS